MPLLEEQGIDRLLDQFRDGDAWVDIVEWYADGWQEILDVIVQLSTETFKDTSEGVWLDRVGEIVGVARPQGEETERVFRVRNESWPEYDPLHGFGNSLNLAMGGLLWSSTGGIPTGTMANDVVFLDYINAKIAATNADASIPGLARYVQDAFGVTCTVTRTGTRSVSIDLLESVDLRQRRYLELLMPAVAGVTVTIINWPDWTGP